MRITIIGPAPPLRGGIAAHTVGLYRALVCRGHDVAVLTFKRVYPRAFFPGTSERDDTAGQLGDAILDTLVPLSWWRARRALDLRCDDLVIVQWWHPIAAPALSVCLGGCRRAPLLVVCHNASPHERFPGWRLASRVALRRADAFLCHSRTVEHGLASAGLVRPTLNHRLPMLIDVADGWPGACRARADLDLDPANPVALCLGHIRGYKGIDVLLAAWDQATLPSGATLLIAGESYLGAGNLMSLLARCRRQASVRVLDRYLSEADIRALLAAADTLVLPHVRASQSGVLPLGLAAGLVIVGTDAGGLGEALAGLEGHFVAAAGSVGELAAAISASFAAPRRVRQRPSPTQYLTSWNGLAASIEGLAPRGAGDLRQVAESPSWLVRQKGQNGVRSVGAAVKEESCDNDGLWPHFYPW